ncbi:MAG: hypothetical protein AB7U82_02110 [Blastocatellales bacterium]
MMSRIKKPFLVGLALLFMTLAGSQSGVLANYDDDDDCCPRPVIYPAPQPICCPAPQPVISCPAPQPVICPAPQPVICPAPQPVITCPAPQPVCVTRYVAPVRTVSYVATPVSCPCN